MSPRVVVIGSIVERIVKSITVSEVERIVIPSETHTKAKAVVMTREVGISKTMRSQCATMIPVIDSGIEPAVTVAQIVGILAFINCAAITLHRFTHFKLRITS